MASFSMKLARVAPRQDTGVAEASGETEPIAFSIARGLLVTILIGASLALGAVVTWAWVALGLAVCLPIFFWAVGNVQQGVLKLTLSLIFIPLTIFFLLGLSQYVTGLALDTSETHEALVLLAADLILFFLTVQLFAGANSRTWCSFGLAVLLFAGSLGLFAILQFASGTQQIYGRFYKTGIFFGSYGNPDHYAGLMEMLIPVGVFFIAGWNRSRSSAALALLLLAVTFAVASLLLSGSRGGLAALLAEIVIASAILRRMGRTREKWVFVTSAAPIILLALLLFSWLDPGWAAKRLGSIIDVPGQAWLQAGDFRKSAALDALRMFRAHPFLGVGLGNFETAYPGYQSFPSDLWIDHAHNDYVEALAETGLLGALLIFWALALFFRLAFREWDQRLRSKGGWIRLGAAVGCCGLLVHSFFDFNLHIPANAAWFAVLAGVATTGNNYPKERSSSP
jgi:O-antigen ligase